MDLRRAAIHKKLEPMKAALENVLITLGIKKENAMQDITRLINKWDLVNGLLDADQRRTLAMAEDARRLMEQINLAETKLSSMIGQARLSFSMIWSAGAQVASMVQQIAARSGATWAEQLGQGLSVLSNIIAIAYASAAIWAGTGPAGIAMAAVQIANATIAMVLQAQMQAQTNYMKQYQTMTAEIEIGEMPF